MIKHCGEYCISNQQFWRTALHVRNASRAPARSPSYHSLSYPIVATPYPISDFILSVLSRFLFIISTVNISNISVLPYHTNKTTLWPQKRTTLQHWLPRTQNSHGLSLQTPTGKESLTPLNHPVPSYIEYVVISFAITGISVPKTHLDLEPTAFVTMLEAHTVCSCTL